tara:strand:- start:848 stop:1072 length:225 start_codon:yes stop_codon:yes gene_type:complete
MIQQRSKQMKKNKIYKIWFQDGSKVFPSPLFSRKEIDEMAKRFDFNKQELIANDFINFMEDGEIIGGVYKLNCV